MWSILEKYSIKTARTALIFSEKTLSDIIKDFEYPIVLKPFSKTGIHKSDLGLIFSNITKREDALLAFYKIKEIMQKNKLEFEGILIQEKIEGIELIVGAKKDPVFKSVIAFGLGGIFVEILKEIQFRTAPITKEEALELIESTKVIEIIKSRGRDYDENKIADFLFNVSQMISTEKITAVDLNPAIVNEKGIFAVDFRIK